MIDNNNYINNLNGLSYNKFIRFNNFVFDKKLKLYFESSIT